MYTADALEEGLQSAAQGFVEGMLKFWEMLLANWSGTPVLFVMISLFQMP